MEIRELRSYTEFLTNIEYPAVVFCESGEVLSINNSAAAILGNKVNSITFEPDKFMSSDEFWPTLEEKKAIIWHRLLLKVNKTGRYIVSGFVNQFEYQGQKAYVIMFELRSDVNIGSVSLERIVNHVGMVALYLYRPDGIWQTRYVSKNISEYGYSDRDFYNGKVKLQDILVKNDYDILIGNIYKSSNTHKDSFHMKTRLVAENGSIKRTDLKVHLVRTADGDIDGIELLFIKKSDSEISDEENSYIMSVMNNIKSFVIVEQIENGHRTLKYITPNARTMGINIDALKKGNKLIRDYVHPEDRDFVANKISDAIKKGLSDAELQYRMVDDSGNVLWVDVKSSITQSEDSSYITESFITDVTENKKLENSVAVAKKEYEDKLSYIMENKMTGDLELVDREVWSELVNAFSCVSNLYSTIIDPEGKPLTEPAGPDTHMGQFYDLFEKPEYKAAYLELNKHILQNNIPVIMDLNDENISCRHMSGAPIKVDGKHIATWILCAYDDEDYIKMKDILDAHWLAATMFSNYIYTNKIVSNEATRSKSVEMLLEEKVRRQQVLTEALNAINDDDDETINGVLTKAGSYLDVDVMAIYARQPDGSYDCSHLWSKDNIMTAEEYLDNWKKGRTNIQNKMIENGILMVDGKHPNKEYLAAMGEANIKSFICMPLEVNSILAGCLVIASVRKPKEWSDDEVEFVRDIRMVVQGILTRIEGDGNIRAVNQLLIDTYNYLMVGIFIRDNETGEVLFSNQALNTMLGYDFKGKDSKILMQDLRDRFRGVRVVEKPFITERKEISWRSYIRQFDKIMDLTEVSMKWLDGRNASLVILRDVKD